MSMIPSLIPVVNVNVDPIAVVEPPRCPDCRGEDVVRDRDGRWRLCACQDASPAVRVIRDPNPRERHPYAYRLVDLAGVVLHSEQGFDDPAEAVLDACRMLATLVDETDVGAVGRILELEGMLAEVLELLASLDPDAAVELRAERDDPAGPSDPETWPNWTNLDVWEPSDDSDSWMTDPRRPTCPEPGCLGCEACADPDSEVEHLPPVRRVHALA